MPCQPPCYHRILVNAPLNTDAEISAALLQHVVNVSGQRPSLEITTSREVFHLVTVEDPIVSTTKDGKLIFVTFSGKDPVGRTNIFIWPPAEVEAPALAITALEVYGQ